LHSQLTVSAGLDGSLNVADTLDGDTVLVVAVDELVLELTNLVDEHTELVGDIRNVVIETLAPDGELLLRGMLVVSLCEFDFVLNLQQPPYAHDRQAPWSA
jgi:hypothetical protein